MDKIIKVYSDMDNYYYVNDNDDSFDVQDVYTINTIDIASDILAVMLDVLLSNGNLLKVYTDKLSPFAQLVLTVCISGTDVYITYHNVDKNIMIKYTYIDVCTDTVYQDVYSVLVDAVLNNGKDAYDKQVI